MAPKHVLLLESESEDDGNYVGKHDSFSSNEDEDKGVDVETVDLDEYLKRGGVWKISNMGGYVDDDCSCAYGYADFNVLFYWV